MLECFRVSTYIPGKSGKIFWTGVMEICISGTQKLDFFYRIIIEICRETVFLLKIFLEQIIDIEDETTICPFSLEIFFLLNISETIYTKVHLYLSTSTCMII